MDSERLPLAHLRPSDPAVRVDLAMEYRSLSRLTGRADWDAKAAAAVAAALAVSPADPQALGVKAWGVLADALTELGRYPEAVAAVEKMMARRPDRAAALTTIASNEPAAMK